MTSNTTAPTQFLREKSETYAYRFELAVRTLLIP